MEQDNKKVEEAKEEQVEQEIVSETTEELDQHSASAETSNEEIEKPDDAKCSKKKCSLSSLLCFSTIVAVAGLSVYSLYLSQKTLSELNNRPVVPDYGREVSDLKGGLAEQAMASKKLEESERRLAAQGADSLVRLDNLTRANESLSANYVEINRKLNGKNTEVAIWKIAEARFLTRLADRKLRIDQDYAMAADLLQEADNLVVSLNDNRAYNLRSVYAREITKLRSTPTFDYEGVALRLSAMADETEAMRFKLQPGSLLEGHKADVSEDLKDWKQNLYASVDDFASKFIVVRSKNETDDMLIHPENQVYVKENLRVLLTAASLAAYRGDFRYFRKNRDEALELLNKYFDESDSKTKALISMLRETDVPAPNDESLEKSYLESVHVVEEFMNDVAGSGSAN